MDFHFGSLSHLIFLTIIINDSRGRKNLGVKLMESYYDIFDFQGEGYKSLLNFETWRVAGLRYSERFDKNNFFRLERHFLTDEVFILLKGEAYLIVGNNQKIPQYIEVIKMEKEKVYNIRKIVWHHILTTKDAYTLIVENSNTSLENSEYYVVTESEMFNIKAKVYFFNHV
jgi:ureidoglycolate hydrolase